MISAKFSAYIVHNGLGYAVVTEKSARFFRTRQSVRKYVGFSEWENPP